MLEGIDDLLPDLEMRYELRVFDNATDEEVVVIESYSQNSLLEQLHKVDSAVTTYASELLATEYEDLT